jgi:hypothetical protein
MLTCPCDARCAARTEEARAIFQQNLTRMHTPDIILNHLICNITCWIAGFLHDDLYFRRHGMAPTTISFKQSTLSSTTYRSARTYRTSMAIKTDTSLGTNLTAVSKSTYLPIDKQTQYTGNPNDKLDCSHHGSLVPELHSFSR